MQKRLIVIIGIIGFTIFGIIFLIPEKEIKITPSIECENLSFYDTSICLNNFVNDVFIYNITDDNISLSLGDLKARGGDLKARGGDLKARGGDCKDWTEFYEKYLNYYGYNQTQKIKIFVREENKTEYYHSFLVAGDETGYCEFDMRDLNCFEYSK